jgi:hypothetical protein
LSGPLCITSQLVVSIRYRADLESEIPRFRRVPLAGSKHKTTPPTDRRQDSVVGVTSPLHSLTLDPWAGILSVIAFHEKAGRSQEDSFWCMLVTLSLPAESPLSPPFHPHSSRSDFVSLGASWVFSFQPVLPPVYRPRFHLQDGSWARRLTQSPELGFKLWLFLSQSDFGFMPPPASRLACSCVTVRKPLRSPTGDAARRPAFAPLQ